MSKRVKDLKLDQHNLKLNATKTLSMAELRAENGNMRQDIIDLQEELKITTNELESKTKELEALIES